MSNFIMLLRIGITLQEKLKKYDETEELMLMQIEISELKFIDFVEAFCCIFCEDELVCLLSDLSVRFRSILPSSLVILYNH